MRNITIPDRMRLFSGKTLMLNELTETHMNHLVHMCFSNIDFSSRIFRRYLGFQKYDELYGNIVFLNIMNQRNVWQRELLFIFRNSHQGDSQMRLLNVLLRRDNKFYKDIINGAIEQKGNLWNGFSEQAQDTKNYLAFLKQLYASANIRIVSALYKNPLFYSTNVSNKNSLLHKASVLYKVSFFRTVSVLNEPSFFHILTALSENFFMIWKRIKQAGRQYVQKDFFQKQIKPYHTKVLAEDNSVSLSPSFVSSDLFANSDFFVSDDSFVGSNLFVSNALFVNGGSLDNSFRLRYRQQHIRYMAPQNSILNVFRNSHQRDGHVRLLNVLLRYENQYYQGILNKAIEQKGNLWDRLSKQAQNTKNYLTFLKQLDASTNIRTESALYKNPFFYFANVLNEPSFFHILTALSEKSFLIWKRIKQAGGQYIQSNFFPKRIKPYHTKILVKNDSVSLFHLFVSGDSFVGSNLFVSNDLSVNGVFFDNSFKLSHRQRYIKYVAAQNSILNVFRNSHPRDSQMGLLNVLICRDNKFYKGIINEVIEQMDNLWDGLSNKAQNTKNYLAFLKQLYASANIRTASTLYKNPFFYFAKVLNETSFFRIITALGEKSFFIWERIKRANGQYVQKDFFSKQIKLYHTIVLAEDNSASVFHSFVSSDLFANSDSFVSGDSFVGSNFFVSNDLFVNGVCFENSFKLRHRQRYIKYMTLQNSILNVFRNSHPRDSQMGLLNVLLRYGNQYYQGITNETVEYKGNLWKGFSDQLYRSENYLQEKRVVRERGGVFLDNEDVQGKRAFSEKKIYRVKRSLESREIIREQKRMQNEIEELKYALNEEESRNMVKQREVELLEEKVIRQKEWIEELEMVSKKIQESLWQMKDDQKEEMMYKRVFRNEMKLERMRYGVTY